MKYLIQFITIFGLSVTLAACQTPFFPAPGSSPDPLPEDVDGTVETPMPDVVFDDVQIAVEEETPLAVETPPPLVADSETDTAAEQAAGSDADAREADLWQRIRDGFQLDHHLDQPRVRAEFDWYVKHPAYLDRVATRASRHLYHIVEQIEARGLPMEFALLPIVESAFDPFAYSHGRASGLWQFIPATGKRYGLTIDYWYDGRRDVPDATRAALDYLEALHGIFDNDWYLALAAYNSGEGNVRYSIRKNVARGRATDFWSLGLLKETRAYVPRLLAISALVADPEKYGVTLKTIPDEPYWAMVDIGSQLDLATAADLAGISTEELYLLNPGYNKWSTRPDGPHRLLLPVDKAPGFLTNLASLPPARRLSWIRHKIASGENLGVIAQRYNTSISSIRAANDLRGNLIRAGDSLLVPVAARNSEAYDLSEAERLKATREYVQRQIGSDPTHYTVRSGDNLWDLSRRFGVSMRSLAKWNGMATTDLLMPGKELVVFTSNPVAVTAPPASNEVIRKVNYRVRRGESLSLIASKFNLPVSSVKKWNREISARKYLQPGDRITLYVDVTKTSY